VLAQGTEGSAHAPHRLPAADAQNTSAASTPRTARVFELRADRIWSSIRAILNDDELQEMPEQLPALMAEELRRMGIV